MLSAWSKMRICLALLLVVMAGSAIAQDVAVVGARVYPAPDATPLDDATVLIRQGRIVAIGPRRKVVVPAGVRIIDAKGASVVAGFWNSHIHLIKPPFHDPDAQPAADLSAALRERFTRWGFTSLFDIASLPGDARALRRRIHQGEVSGPQVLTVDMPFFLSTARPSTCANCGSKPVRRARKSPRPKKHASVRKRRLLRGLMGSSCLPARLSVGRAMSRQCRWTSPAPRWRWRMRTASLPFPIRPTRQAWKQPSTAAWM